jgi:2-oxo-4-hydroxy-4-carboxy-5-ureidoimidazoline decarboxylase
MTLSIEQLDRLPPGEAAFKLASCCGSSAWIAGMVEKRPYGSGEGLLNAAEDVFRSMLHTDWLDAFAHHPRIGEEKAAAVTSAAAQAYSLAEQSTAGNASRDVQAALAAANAEYERKFRFIFIISATGKSAEDILAVLQERLANERDAEIFIAAREQQKITRLRLKQLIHASGVRA